MWWQTALEAFAEEMRQRKAAGKMDTKALLAAIDAASSSSSEDEDEDNDDGEGKGVDRKAAMAVMMALIKKKQQEKKQQS